MKYHFTQDDPFKFCIVMDLKEICARMHAFVEQKNWYTTPSVKPQTPKNLAISLSLESAELLECFQWKEDGDVEAVSEELADIIMYAAQIANTMNIDLDEAMEKKFQINSKRQWK